MKRVAAAAALLAAAGAAQAGLLRACDTTQAFSAAQQDRLLRFAALIKQALNESGATMALVARSGTDLSRFGLRYSHAGIALREGLDSPWAVRQLYFACAEGAPRLFDQGLAGFVAGTDSPEVGYVSLLLLPPEAAQALAPAALDKALALRLLAARYSANAYPFSTQYQNCNQWVAELIAAAFLPEASREAAQAWLRAEGYAPEPVHVASPWLMLAGRFVPWLHFDDHPAEPLQAREVQTSLPPGLEAFALRRWPTARRIEFCHGAQGVVRHDGQGQLADGCTARPGDHLTRLD